MSVDDRKPESDDLERDRIEPDSPGASFSADTVSNEARSLTGSRDSRSFTSSSEKSFLFTGKTALISTLIAIVMSPISLVIGFLLNHALQQPRWEVAYVDRTLFTTREMPSKEQIEPVVAHKGLRIALLSNLARSADMKNARECIDWLDGGKFDPECFDAVYGIASGLLSTTENEIEAIRENLRRIEKKEIREKGYRHMDNVRAEFLALDPDRMAPLLRGQLGELDDMMKTLRPFVGVLSNLREVEKLTGEVALTAGC